MMKKCVLLALAGSASAKRTTDKYPYPRGPCADQNDAANVWFNSEYWFNTGCKNPDVLANCGKFPIGSPTEYPQYYGEETYSPEHQYASYIGVEKALMYDFVSALCPESCGICEPAFPPKDLDKQWAEEMKVTYRYGDSDDLMAAIGYGACASMGHLCDKDATVRALCGETCSHGCDRRGFRMRGVNYGINQAFQQKPQSCMGTPHDKCPLVKYGEAEDLCESWGAKICTLDELKENMFRRGANYPDPFDKGDDYFVGNGHMIVDYKEDASVGGDELVDDGSTADEQGDETVVVGDTRQGGRVPDDRCSSDDMQVWVHPQSVEGCHMSGHPGHQVANVGNGNRLDCLGLHAKAYPMCCWEGQIHSNSDAPAPGSRKLAGHVLPVDTSLIQLDRSGSVELRKAMAEKK